MLRKLPTLLILMVMVLVGAMYWVDLSYYTDPVTGFNTRGEVWVRYAVAALPILMCLLGIRTIGPKAISVLRVKNPALGWCFGLAAVVGIAWGGTRIVFSLAPVNAFNIALGFFNMWYGVWMFAAAIQMFTQNHAAPSKSAAFGVMAAMPFALTTIQRILVNPSSVYRVGPLVRSFSGLFAMLWVGLLLRSFYIALPRRRVRWLYMCGVLTFLFGTCLELPLAVHTFVFNTVGQGRLELFESINMGMVGLVAGAVSLAIAGRSELRPKKTGEEEAGEGAAPDFSGVAPAGPGKKKAKREKRRGKKAKGQPEAPPEPYGGDYDDYGGYSGFGSGAGASFSSPAASPPGAGPEAPPPEGRDGP